LGGVQVLGRWRSGEFRELLGNRVQWADRFAVQIATASTYITLSFHHA